MPKEPVKFKIRYNKLVGASSSKLNQGERSDDGHGPIPADTFSDQGLYFHICLINFHVSVW